MLKKKNEGKIDWLRNKMRQMKSKSVNEVNKEVNKK